MFTQLLEKIYFPYMYNSTPTKGLNGPIFLTWPMKIILSWSLWKFYDSADSLTKFAENADSLSGANHKEIEFFWKILSLQNFIRILLANEKKKQLYLEWAYVLTSILVHEIPSYKI